MITDRESEGSIRKDPIAAYLEVNFQHCFIVREYNAAHQIRQRPKSRSHTGLK
jgi:hypothetical protein